MRLSIFFLVVPLVGAWWVELKELTFEEARSYCFPGDLATFSTNQELKDLLRTNQQLRRALANQSTVHLWVGLEKPKDLCVVQDLPLRGFRWIDGGQASELSVWREEPKDTCTNIRCGALAVDSKGWGLVSQKCKTKNRFICGPESAERPESPEETRPGSEETRPGPEETRPEPEETTPGPEETTPGPEETSPGGTRPGPAGTREPRPDPGPDPNPGLNEEQIRVGPSFVPDPDLGPSLVLTPTSGSEAPSSDPVPGPGPVHRSCSVPVVPGSRSLSLDPDEPDLVSVECWSGEELLLRCSDGDWVRSEPSEPDPGLDLTPDQNRTLLVQCSGCGPGLQLRDGQCEDVDECSLSPAPCAHGCVNAHGSFTCTPAPLSAALVPVLITVALVTLALVAAVTVWCCIRKKRQHREKKQDQN